MAPETPVAMVERATWPDMRVASGTMETIVDVRDDHGIEPPAITIIGEVAATRHDVVEFLRNRTGDRVGGHTEAVPNEEVDE